MSKISKAIVLAIFLILGGCAGTHAGHAGNQGGSSHQH